MFPEIDHLPEVTQEDIPASFSIRVKEAFFLTLVFLMSFSGLSLCIDKIYPEDDNTLEDIVVHDSDMAHLDI